MPLMISSEEASANLSADGRILNTIERFPALERIGNLGARVFPVAFFERIGRTADVTHSLLGVIVTARGLASDRGLSNESLHQALPFRTFPSLGSL
jgi:hypothetical protein